MPCPSHVWHHLPNRRGVGSRSTGPIRGDDPASVSFPSVQCAWCTRPTASIAQEDENNMKKVPSFNHSSINSLLKPSGRHRNGRCSLAPRRGVLRRGSHGQSGVRQARPVRRMLYGAWVTGLRCSGEASPSNGIRRLKLRSRLSGSDTAPEGAFQVQTGISNPWSCERSQRLIEGGLCGLRMRSRVRIMGSGLWVQIDVGAGRRPGFADRRVACGRSGRTRLSRPRRQGEKAGLCEPARSCARACQRAACRSRTATPAKRQPVRTKARPLAPGLC
jgi:hypothetical protein